MCMMFVIKNSLRPQRMSTPSPASAQAAHPLVAGPILPTLVGLSLPNVIAMVLAVLVELLVRIQVRVKVVLRRRLLVRLMVAVAV